MVRNYSEEEKQEYLDKFLEESIFVENWRILRWKNNKRLHKIIEKITKIWLNKNMRLVMIACF